MKKCVLIVPTILFVIAIVSCKTIPTEPLSEVKYIGANEIPEKSFPEVRQLKIFEKIDGMFSLKKFCTIVFVKPDIALTAAHCVCSGDRFTFEIAETWKDYEVKKVVRHPDYQCGRRVPDSADLAILFFEKTLEMPHVNISGQTLSSGEVQAVGYGNNILTTRRKYIFGTKVETSREKTESYRNQTEYEGKRLAEDYFSGEFVDGFYRLKEKVVVGDAGGETEGIASAEGDSGGPLFSKADRTLIGILSRGGFKVIDRKNVEVISDYVNISSPENRRFLSVLP